MNTKITNILLMAALYLMLFIPFQGYTDNGNSSSPPDFSEFRIILERNIFDPGRTPGYGNAARSRERPPETERLYLKGVLIQKGAALAFFEGTKAAYNAIRTTGESIGEFKISHIHTERIIIEGEGRRIEIPVGSGLMKEEGREWELSAALHSSAQSIPEPKNAASTEGNAPGDDEAMSDIMKKMMERRQKETGQ